MFGMESPSKSDVSFKSADGELPAVGCELLVGSHVELSDKLSQAVQLELSIKSSTQSCFPSYK